MSIEITDESLSGFPSGALCKHQRHIPMGTPHNLRTLAGISTQDGRDIAAGKLYRSDSVAQLSGESEKRLSALQLKVVTDFRSSLEQKNTPHQWSENNIDIIHRPIPVMGDNGRVELMRVLQSVDSAEDVAHWLRELYRSMVIDFSHVYAEWLHSLLNDDSYPQLYHCTAGKDRTGVATALLLKLLGVADVLIMDDFLLSNELSAEYIEARTTGKVAFSWMPEGVNPDFLRPLLSVQKEFLEATFSHINEECGSFAQYAKQCLGMTSKEISQLRKNLLVPG
ncbi:tyrosine-protein phosphatase [Endozoicomonas euniceicola]|uniref:Tyrosine-protein phosphatase n=1 Tax=Endozoicomonas euniceicola TaxID=1234143 RepID=A0ABY6GZ96_9GAMM|nr:tyrosine-protein phosphatase [Endozoicomonas euniceicola]UYM17341.1 tyrosine-protein phosphatase [Endozoicomonas euniceicola]